MISVQVCYALPTRQALLDVAVPEGATLREAVEASGIIRQFPEIDLTVLRTGIFGHLAPLDAVLHEGDRVEIYRPLQVDPKAARQRRVDKTRREGSIEGRKWLHKDSR
jgi:uncharacterized protein